MNNKRLAGVLFALAAAGAGCSADSNEQLIALSSETRAGFRKSETFNCRTNEVRIVEDNSIIAGRAYIGGVKTNTYIVQDQEQLARYKALCRERFGEPAPAK